MNTPDYYIDMASHHLDCLQGYWNDEDVPRETLFSYTVSALANLVSAKEALGEKDKPLEPEQLETYAGMARTRDEVSSLAVAAPRFERMERYLALCRKYWIAIKPDGPWETSAEEDVAAIVNGDESLERWAAVTMHDPEMYYVQTFAMRETAIQHSIENVNDDIFNEAPVALCDLDANVEPWGKLYPLRSLIPVYDEPI